MEFSESEVYRFLLLYELCINYALEKKCEPQSVAPMNKNKLYTEDI